MNQELPKRRELELILVIQSRGHVVLDFVFWRNRGPEVSLEGELETLESRSPKADHIFPIMGMCGPLISIDV
jgi:hypothetical protein